MSAPPRPAETDASQGWRFRHSRITLRMLVLPCVIILVIQGMLSIIFAHRAAEISEAREQHRLVALIKCKRPGITRIQGAALQRG